MPVGERAALAEAIGAQGCLLPLAFHAHEYPLHRARIARSRQRWQEMRDHVSDVRGMMEGTRPFCTLPDGTPVLLADLQRFYRSLAPLSEAEQRACEGVLDDGVRLRGFERFAGELYLLPGFVIPYP